MINKLSISLAALMAMGIAGAASAQIVKTNTVDVNIEVLPELSFWFGHPNVSLELGTGPENLDVFESTMNYISNVAGTITAEVDGALPTPTVPGGGIQFYIFPDMGEAAAISAIQGNAYNPVGSLAWNQAALGTTQTLYSAPVSQTISTIPWTYGAATPGGLPLPDDWALTVTYTMTED
ncbi:hypothetical protein [Roseinatronobacter bogoriensis]|nr:hypothetical protein [Rhodobaca]MBB4208502.1 hypothetical protein [Rhodobaca bogoriensis DSM 18756]TDW39141.1 hypothetical protein LY39_02172 [Rhodobaca barguzinensis]TDY66461.1 hypothetical protein EV660_11171 [Rhodobaca bogoriensis DSM 18756]